MADERKLLSEVERGEHAARVLANPAYVEAWATYEMALLSAWRVTRVDQSKERETIWTALQTAEKVRSILESVLKTGQMAAAQLKELHK